MEIKLTPEESEEYFFNALCNGLSYIESYGLVLTYDDKEYSKARLSLKKKDSNDSICFESVVMEILRLGGTLTFKDMVGTLEEDINITMKEVHERVMKTPVRFLMDMIKEEDDADTADVMLQQVLFNDVIFG